MMNKIPWPSDAAAVNLPALLESRLLVQANSGGGKSWALRRLLEVTAPHVQQLVIDPEGEFATLRERFDYVIAAPHDADAVATPKTAALLARRLLESGVSAILDIYDLKAHERQLFVRRFLDALINAPRTLWRPVLVVVDEAHTFCPQTGSAEAASAVIDLATRGRKRGQCLVLATQRLSKLHKDAAAEMLNKLVGRTGLDVDVKRAADELGMTPRDAMEQLRGLSPGEFYAFGPALSAAVEKVTLGPVVTTHPKSGHRLMQAPPAASAKVRAQLAKLADLQQEAEEEARTMEELRQQLATARGQLTKAEKRAEQAGVPEAEVLKRIQKSVDDARRTAKPDIGPAIVQGMQEREEARKMPQVAALARKLLALVEQGGATVVLAHHISSPAVKREPVAVGAIAEGLSGPQQRILDAIAWIESIGVAEPEQTVVAFLSGYSGSDNGAYKNPRGALNQAGLVRYVAGGGIALTDEGRERANRPTAAGSAEELQARVLAKIPGPETRILSVLIEAYPRAISNDELARSAGYSGADNGAYKNPRGRLRSFGLVEYQSGSVRAATLLFPKAKP